MSLILAGGNNNFLIVGGEQRVLDKEGKVLSEYYRKVYKVNEDLIVAFAGKIKYCEEILAPLINKEKASDHPLTNVEIVDYVENKANAIADRLAGTAEEKCFFGIIVCGKTLHKRPRDSKQNPYFMHMYTYNGKLTVSKNMLKDNGIRWSSLYGSRYNHKKICKELFARKQAMNMEDTREVFNQTFSNGARHDRTMNNKVIYEILQD